MAKARVAKSMVTSVVPRRVKLRLGYASVEANIPAEAELFVDVVEIIADFLPRRIEFAELPFPPQVVARILIDWAGRIDPGARVTIPIPDAAKTAPGLKHLNGHAHVAQTVKEIEAGESGADYDDVKIFDLTVVRPFRFSRAHMIQFPRRVAGDCASRRHAKRSKSGGVRTQQKQREGASGRPLPTARGAIFRAPDRIS
jgi:hypothetical protein